MDAERLKPKSLYVEESLAHALHSEWEQAVVLNKFVLEEFGPDSDAYNRLGKASLELGDLDAAEQAYASALALNPRNGIAEKNLVKIAHLRGLGDAVGPRSTGIDADFFAEEPGRSALTSLTPPQGVPQTIVAGDTVELYVEKGALLARTIRGVALGRIEMKIARRILPLIETGNRYAAAVVRSTDESIEIILRETYQCPENVRKTSFPISKRSKRDEFRPYSKAMLVRHDDGDTSLDSDDDAITPTEDDEDVPMASAAEESEETEGDDRPEDAF